MSTNTTMTTTNTSAQRFEPVHPQDMVPWPEREIATIGVEPGPMSHTAQWEGRTWWVFGALVLDVEARELFSYAMQDATNLERASVSHTKVKYRGLCLEDTAGVEDPGAVFAGRPWVPVRNSDTGLWTLSIARACPLGGPENGMGRGAFSDETAEHRSRYLPAKGVLPEGVADMGAFTVERVWSPEHGVQLSVSRVDDGEDGPGQSVASLIALHRHLGDELARFIADYPEAVHRSVPWV